MQHCVQKVSGWTVRILSLFSESPPLGTRKHWKTLGPFLYISQEISGASSKLYVFHSLLFLQTIWSNLTVKLMTGMFFWQSTKKRFLKTFMPQLRRKKTAKRKLKALFKQISSLKIKRGAGKGQCSWETCSFYVAATESRNYFDSQLIIIFKQKYHIWYFHLLKVEDFLPFVLFILFMSESKLNIWIGLLFRQKWTTSNFQIFRVILGSD